MNSNIGENLLQINNFRETWKILNQKRRTVKLWKTTTCETEQITRRLSLNVKYWEFTYFSSLFIYMHNEGFIHAVLLNSVFLLKIEFVSATISVCYHIGIWSWIWRRSCESLVWDSVVKTLKPLTVWLFEHLKWLKLVCFCIKKFHIKNWIKDWVLRLV